MPVYPGATQMILRQPLHQRRRHQQQLTTITPAKFSSHPGSVLNTPDSTDIPTASRQRRRPACTRRLQPPGRIWRPDRQWPGVGANPADRLIGKRRGRTHDRERCSDRSDMQPVRTHRLCRSANRARVGLRSRALSPALSSAVTSAASVEPARCSSSSGGALQGPAGRPGPLRMRARDLSMPAPTRGATVRSEGRSATALARAPWAIRLRWR